MLRNYSNRNLIKHPDLNGILLLDEDFIQKIDMLCWSAESLDVTLFALKGFDKRENLCSHSIGCGIELNLIIEDKLYTAQMLRDDPPKELAKLVAEAKRNGIRWGGNFENKNEKHWDSNFVSQHPAIAKLKYLEYNG